jgi:hypothetical protein
MAQGEPRPALARVASREVLWATLPPAALCLAVLLLGVYIPPTMSDLLHQAALALGGK